MSNEISPLLRQRHQNLPNHHSNVRACWLGKSIGGTLGLPVEGRMERMHFTFYNPVPISAPPNDDLELQLVWLHLIETAGSSLSQADFAQAWLKHIHYMWDEYGRCRWNLRRGVPPEHAGTFENHFNAGMGSPIRSEIWACLFPGDPASAGYYAALDASLDHGTEGIAGEVFFAVLQSLVAGGMPLEAAFQAALAYIPRDCETSLALRLILQLHASSTEVWECWRKLLEQHGSENFTHAPLNVALTIWALIYGAGNFEKSILLAVNGGYDTDCTAATAGATLGLLLGEAGIPARWIEPIGEDVFVGAGIVGIHAPRTLTELTDRTVSLIGKLEPRQPADFLWQTTSPAPELTALPGTLLLKPRHSVESIPWANGELPREIKQAGGGAWIWEHASDDPREIICLAREGARLFIGDQLLIECPPGLPYVPATHRSANGSRTAVTLKAGQYPIRLELNSRIPEQEASVILAYPNLHIAPWTGYELPHRADLPAS